MEPRTDSQLEALTAAMATVPLLYSRNRMFALFKDPLVRRARVRARLVRGLIRFIGREDAEVELSPPHEERVRVAYRISRLHLSRAVQITEFELALLRVLLAKGPHAHHVGALAEQEADRARVDAALALLPKDAIPSVA